MEVLFAILSALAAVITLISFVRRVIKSDNGVLIAYAAMLVLMTATSTYLFQELKDERSAKRAAAELVESWPTLSRLRFCETGELQGIIVAGIGFLEQHRDRFPKALDIAEHQILHVQLGDFEPLLGDVPISESVAYARKYRNAAGAMITLLRAVSNGS